MRGHERPSILHNGLHMALTTYPPPLAPESLMDLAEVLGASSYFPGLFLESLPFLDLELGTTYLHTFLIQHTLVM